MIPLLTPGCAKKHSGRTFQKDRRDPIGKATQVDGQGGPRGPRLAEGRWRQSSKLFVSSRSGSLSPLRLYSFPPSGPFRVIRFLTGTHRCNPALRRWPSAALLAKP